MSGGAALDGSLLVRDGALCLVALVNVTAIIVTRGDVDLDFRGIPREWEIAVWDNGAKHCEVVTEFSEEVHRVSDLSVYGRYAAIEYASNDLIYVQDDDCVVSDPQAIVDEFIEKSEVSVGEWGMDMVRPWEGVVCNMPPQFRHGFYEEHALVGFGAVFHRDAPERAFERFMGAFASPDAPLGYTPEEEGLFHRTCDVVFTALTPRVLVDVLVENLPWAEDENRMYRQPGHVAERAKMLELAFRAKDVT